MLTCVRSAPPFVLFLDGLEVRQSAPQGEVYGRLLDGVLRSVLIALCQARSNCLAVLTSRFPFADLEPFTGTTARMMDLERLSTGEGSELLRLAGGEWLSADERMRLAASVEGHALGTSVLAAALQEQLPTGDIGALTIQLESMPAASARVARVIQFYSDRLSEDDRMIVATVSLFQRPVRIDVVHSLGSHPRVGPIRYTITEVEEYPGRAHLMTAQEGWQQIADDVLAWAVEHAKTS